MNTGPVFLVAAVMLAIIIAVFRQRQSVDVDDMDLMQG